MSDPLKAAEPTTAFRGAILTVSTRWLDRLMGLASTVILARVLVPEDFGLVAMAMVVVGLMDVLLDLGVGSALVQNTRADAEDFHTAWTLRLLQSAFAAVLLVVGAPFVAGYFDDARVETILRVVAITVVVGGLENIGTVSFQKNMEFGRDFRFLVLKRTIGVVFTVAAAVTLRSYWALVLGSLVTRVAGVGLSYVLSAFRPRFSLSRLAQIWSFSQWNLLMGIANYLYRGFGQFIIGRRDDAATLGAYTMGEEIAMLPTTELLAPLGRVMFPVFAASKDDPSESLRLLQTTQGVQAIVAIPTGTGLALVAGDAVPLLLGQNWSGAVPFVQIISLASIPTALSHSSTYMLLALGRIKTLCAISWARMLILVLLVLTVFLSAGARGVALSTLVTACGAFAVLQAAVGQAVAGFGALQTARQIWRPAISTVVMGGAVHAVSRALEGAALPLKLLLEIGTGVLTYGIAVLILWRTAGAPVGAETYLLEKVRLRRSQT